MAALHPSYRAIVLDQQAQLKRLVTSAGVAPIKSLYEDMLAQLVSRLQLTQSETFTHQQLTGLVAQVKLGLARLQRPVNDAFAGAAGDVGVGSARSALENAARLERRFAGAVMPLPLLEIGGLRGLVQGRTSSLLRVNERSMARFGAQLVGRMETELASSLSLGENYSQAIDRVQGVGDMEWWRAERVVRTELSAASNLSARGAMEEQAAELDGDMWMRWSEHVSDDGVPLDDRVGVDSEAMNGQVAPPGGMFTQPPVAPDGEAVSGALVGQQWAAPPNRPNDRAVLIPWRVSWGVPGWRWEGRRVPVTAAAAERQNSSWVTGRPPELRPTLVERPADPDVRRDDDASPTALPVRDRDDGFRIGFGRVAGETEDDEVMWLRDERGAIDRLRRQVAEQLSRRSSVTVPDPVPVVDPHRTFTVDGTAMRMDVVTKAPAPGARPRTHVTVSRTLGDGEEVIVATAEFAHRATGLYPEHVNVEPRFQRRGIGTRIYSAAERASGLQVMPSQDQTAAGAAFSAKFRKR
jgi:hypothetical protein